MAVKHGREEDGMVEGGGQWLKLRALKMSARHAAQRAKA